MSKLLLTNVTKNFSNSFGEVTCILKGIDLEISDGAFFTLLGASGCGKSTLLNIVAGFEDVSGWEILIDSHAIEGPGTDRTVIFQDVSNALFPYMTVFENVAFGLRMHRRMTEQAIHDRVDVCLKQVALLDADEKMPVDLSGGMRKRAALARSIALEPDFILYDEPTTGLDPRTANVVGDLILQLQRDLDITSVVVTHDIPLTMRISDKIALIDQGVVAASGSPEEVEQSSIFKKFFEGELGNQDEA